NNLAVTLRDAKQFDEAIDCFRHALEIDPECGEAYSSLGMTFQEQGDLAEALVCYDEALRLGNVQPAGSPSAASVTTWPSQYDLAAVHRNRAFANLLLGNYASGLDEYEWRWHTEGASKRLPLAEWDGAPLEGRPILLSHEQGLGDMIQFIRYAPLVQQRGGTVVVGCPQSLMPLLKTCPGVDRLIYQHELASGIEVQAALMSLPRIFRTELDSIPAGIPYLFADQQLTEHWRGVLSPRGGLRVGIAWQGNPDYKGDRYRSIPLACFAPLATVCGVRLISLQKGHGQEQLAAATFEIEDLGSQLDNEGHAFFDTAAVMQNLDLVITSDTAIAHLAGALGARVWLALPRVPDWRWHMDRDDSPWYPTMRLFRQSRWGDWTDVFEAIRNELGRLR
ncbi:MAG TPA: tetratricopeptide repeat protein, partial [Pirellulales bacterium]|nr:tetratricopeptide repeat protein [Pirellulales bacterium]